MTKTDSDCLRDLAGFLEKKSQIRALRAAMAKDDKTIDAAKEEKDALWCTMMAQVCRRAAGKIKAPRNPSLALRPSLEEWMEYAKEIGMLASEAHKLFDHFQSNGWKVGGKAPMEDWKAALRNGFRRWQETAPGVAKKLDAGAKKDPEGWRAWLVMKRLDYREYWRANPGIHKAFNEREK